MYSGICFATGGGGGCIACRGAETEKIQNASFFGDIASVISITFYIPHLLKALTKRTVWRKCEYIATKFVKSVMQFLVTGGMRELATNPQIKRRDQKTRINKLSPFYAHLECKNYRRVYQCLSVSAFFTIAYFPDHKTCVGKQRSCWVYIYSDRCCFSFVMAIHRIYWVKESLSPLE